MPTQRELDELQQRTKAQSGTIGRVYGREGSIQDVSTNAPTENTSNRTDVDSDSNQRAVDEFRPRYGVGALEGGGGSGGGLPPYPGPDTTDIKGVLVWDDTAGEALWTRGETVPPSTPEDYLDFFTYDPQPAPAGDYWSLFRMEKIEGIICENGAPVTKVILVADPIV